MGPSGASKVTNPTQKVPFVNFAKEEQHLQLLKSQRQNHEVLERAQRTHQEKVRENVTKGYNVIISELAEGRARNTSVRRPRQRRLQVISQEPS